MQSETNVLISIIVPVYNREKAINRCIDSCLSQTYSNLELILIDDYSTDGTVEVIRAWEKKDRRIIVLQNTANRGPSYSRNRGLRQAKGALVTFLDSDDYILPDKLKIAADHFANHSTDIFISTYKRVLPNGAVKNHDNIKPVKNMLREFLTKKFRWSMIVPVWKRPFIEEHVGLFNENLKLGEDFEFHFRALLKKPIIYYSSACLTMIDDTNIDMDKDKIRNSGSNRDNLKSFLRSRRQIVLHALKSQWPMNDKLFVFNYFVSIVLSVLKKELKGSFHTKTPKNVS